MCPALKLDATHEHEEERHPSEHPHCIFCETPMQLTLIEPSADEGYDWRSFKCPTCSNAVTAKIKYR